MHLVEQGQQSIWRTSLPPCLRLKKHYRLTTLTMTFQLTLVQSIRLVVHNDLPQPSLITFCCLSSSAPQPKCAQPMTSSVGDLVQEFILNLKNCMSHRLRRQFLDHLLKIIVDSKGLDFYKFVNKDFLSSSLRWNEDIVYEQ